MEEYFHVNILTPVIEVGHKYFEDLMTQRVNATIDRYIKNKKDFHELPRDITDDAIQGGISCHELFTHAMAVVWVTEKYPGKMTEEKLIRGSNPKIEGMRYEPVIDWVRKNGLEKSFGLYKGDQGIVLRVANGSYRN
jgi:hypothetical protein